MRRIAIALLAVVLFACASHYTTARDPSGTRIYAMAAPKALQIAHRALVETFPGRKITHLTGPTWGYSTTSRFVLDTYSQQVLVRALSGLGADGQTVEGIVFEVSGSGTSGSGWSLNKGLFDRIQSLANDTGTGQIISQAKEIELEVPISPERTDRKLPTDQRLRELSDSFNQGLITREEFEKKREEILEDL